MKQKKLPKFLRKYFWDVDVKNLDKKKYSFFIIERLLELGDKKAIDWLEKNYKKREIKRVVKKSRSLSRKSCIFWAQIFNLSKNQVLCLKKLSRKMPKTAWQF